MNEIKVGDIVRLKGTTHEAIVTRFTETTICLLFRDGSCGNLCAKGNFEGNFEETDKHFDSIDEFMRSADD
jgi:hypothetical protein